MKELESIESFAAACRIKPETWTAAGIEIDLLQQIAEDHSSQIARLTDSAELFAKVAQRIPCVHSVRWRIKDPLHLAEKIVRKRAERNEKYLAISVENYSELITDLVGVRALHLFKDDCFAIDSSLRESWELVEKPIAYIRQGDNSALTERYSSFGFDVKSHPKGYRSIHYVFANQPHQRKVFAEIQVRSLFEEGWSEIDHRVRYPNFSDHEMVEYFLTIFNRMAGSADEMGSFVRRLVSDLDGVSLLVSTANEERDAALARVEEAVKQLDDLKIQDAESNQKIARLQNEISNLRSLHRSSKDSLDKGLIHWLGSPQSDFLKQISGLDGDSLGSLLNRLNLRPETSLEMIRRVGLAGAVNKPDK